ncbi:unnamed protein product [Caenorhabditis angaria]|uniref:Septin and tuftelin-interacting protein 1 homolog n=1 Tax=Caenorhabditis angaria TaxID=860376 RepID=A0A9P1MYA7_9PELO|nr:unnamed protein product [Caenorhabditis angaria]
MDEDDEGNESFEINDQDLEYAMNPGRRHFQSKEQATYGIWSTRDESDEDERSSKGPVNKRGKYTAPVGFVSGGIQQGSSKKPDKNDPDTVSQATYSSSKTSEDGAIQIDFGKRAKPKESGRNGAEVFAGMRSSATKGTIDPNKYCDWLKHGKGSVVMKMMESMGYKQGEGLGAEGQGIVEPVQAALRKGRGAVGAYGKEMTGPKFGESAADAQKRLASGGSVGKFEEDDQEKPEKISIKGGWKKSQRVQTRYKTMEDVMEEKMGGNGGSAKISREHAQTKVIDMTGPQQRVYSGYDSFSMKTKSEYELEDDEKREVFDVPELIHNLNLLVDLTEESIRRKNQQIISIKDQTTALEYDRKQIKNALENEENEQKKIENVYSLINGFAAGNNAGMNECQELMRKLRNEYPNEYRIYSLESVAIPVVLPLLQKFFENWRPLDPEHVIYGVELMREWNEILTGGESMKSTFGMNKSSFDEIPAYDRLIWEGWLPSLRKSTLSWDPRDEMEEMMNLIETWIPLLPNWIKENILEQLIIPRINERVNNWDPTKDPIPIHSWLIPWLVILGDRIQIVMPPIRQKLQKALKLWDPKDRSAMGILRPWKDVWSTGTFSAFLAQNIVPKLAKSLNPEYEEWKAVMDWMEFIQPPDPIVNIVVKHFFPRFIEVLCRWLDSPNANIGEVKMWYSEWKNRIPPKIAQFPTVTDWLKRSLICIGKSMQGERVSNLPLPLPLPQQPQMAPNFAPRPQVQQISLKDAIEMTAARNGFTYHPQKDRFKDGRQVYWFGTVSMYIDSGMVFVMDPKEFVWRPTGLDELIRLAGG